MYKIDIALFSTCADQIGKVYTLVQEQCCDYVVKRDLFSFCVSMSIYFFLLCRTESGTSSLGWVFAQGSCDRMFPFSFQHTLSALFARSCSLNIHFTSYLCVPLQFLLWRVFLPKEDDLCMCVYICSSHCCHVDAFDWHDTGINGYIYIDTDVHTCLYIQTNTIDVWMR